MKKGLGLMIIGGIGLIGYGLYYYFSKQINLLKQFQYKILTFHIDQLDMAVLKGTVTFRFTSVSDIEITINQFYLDFYLNGQKIGYLEDVSRFIIPAQWYSDIPFQYTLNPSLVVSDIGDIVAYATSSSGSVVTVSGYANITTGFISATVPITCTIALDTLDCNCT